MWCRMFYFTTCIPSASEIHLWGSRVCQKYGCFVMESDRRTRKFFERRFWKCTSLSYLVISLTTDNGLSLTVPLVPWKWLKFLSGPRGALCIFADGMCTSFRLWSLPLLLTPDVEGRQLFSSCLSKGVICQSGLLFHLFSVYFHVLEYTFRQLFLR